MTIQQSRRTSSRSPPGPGSASSSASSFARRPRAPRRRLRPIRSCASRPTTRVTVIVKHLDKGQGIATGLSTLVAEELDADWRQMRAEFAPADASKYNNLLFGKVQGTGGSTSIANSFTQYRKAGAIARAMLVAAAAAAWGVPAAEIAVAQGVLTHKSGRSGTFGEFAERAAQARRAEGRPAQERGGLHLYRQEFQASRHRGQDHRPADLHPGHPSGRHGDGGDHPSAALRRRRDEDRHERGNVGQGLPGREDHSARRCGLRERDLAGVQGQGARQGRVGRSEG